MSTPQGTEQARPAEPVTATGWGIGWGTAALLLSVALAVAWPTFTGGGFNHSSQDGFVVVATVALLTAVWVDPAALLLCCRAPAVRVLAALAGLSVLSVAWTIVSPDDSLRMGLVVCGYAACALSAGVLARRGGWQLIALGVGLVAAIEAVDGMAAAATHSLPDAARLVLVWRPGGTYQYQPAVALLEAGALAVFWWAIKRPGWPLQAFGAFGAVLAGALLGVSADRLGAGLAIVILLGLGWQEWRSERSVGGLLAAVFCAGVGAVVSLSELDHAVRRHAHGPGWDAIWVILAVALATAVVVPLVRRSSQRLTGWARRVGVAASVIALSVAVIARLLAGVGAKHHIYLRSAGFFHGRLQEWHAAIETWFAHPLLGTGAGSYGAASFSHQSVAVSLYAHNLILETAAELGIPGLICALSLYVALVWQLVRGRGNDVRWVLGPLVAAFMVSNLLDWTWHLAALGAVWAICLGVVSGVGGADVD
jgi:energy-converting hydrogenase Eha subunit A